MFANLAEIAGLVGTLAGTFSSVYLFRRARKAEVQSSEVLTADQMVELVKKAYSEESAARDKMYQREIDKLKKQLNVFKKAFKIIYSCPHSSECPVPRFLQSDEDSEQ